MTTTRTPGRTVGKPQDFTNATWVAKWAGLTFTNPVPLVHRFQVRVGDRIASSHYGAVYVVRTTADDRPADAVGAVQFWLRRQMIEPTVANSQPWTERYEDTMSVPLLERDGVVYGTIAGGAEAKRLWGDHFEKRPYFEPNRGKAIQSVQSFIRQRSGGLIRPDFDFAAEIVDEVLGAMR